MEDNNKLIAEFMGNPTIFNTIHDATLYQVKEQGNMTYHIDELQYHLSWDWLMPVIQKCLIGQTEVSRGLTNTNVSRILDGLCYQDMSRTYKAVVEFIKEYNDGKN